MYLCSVRVVRAHGYQVREQDFKPEKGTLIAARSTPDPKTTVIARGFFRRAREVVWNAWEHGKFEFWDEDDASARARTDERIVVKFRQGSGGFWGWLTHNPRTRTKVTVSADVTEYGKEDWVIKRDKRPAAIRDAVYQSIMDCVGAPSPSVYTAKVKATGPSTLAPVITTPVEPTTDPGEQVTAVASPPVAPATDPAAALTEARNLYEAGKYSAAAPLLASVVAAEPDNAEALGYLGAAYYQLKRLDDAIIAYEAYVKLVPSDGRTQEFIEEMKKERTGKPKP